MTANHNDPKYDEKIDWRRFSKCSTEGIDPEWFYPGDKDYKTIASVKLFCFSCPVRTRCLLYALDNRIEYGVFGGFTSRERYFMLKKQDIGRTQHIIEYPLP